MDNSVKSSFTFPTTFDTHSARASSGISGVWIAPAAGPAPPPKVGPAASLGKAADACLSSHSPWPVPLERKMEMITGVGPGHDATPSAPPFFQPDAWGLPPAYSEGARPPASFSYLPFGQGLPPPSAAGAPPTFQQSNSLSNVRFDSSDQRGWWLDGPPLRKFNYLVPETIPKFNVGAASSRNAETDEACYSTLLDDLRSHRPTDHKVISLLPARLDVDLCAWRQQEEDVLQSLHPMLRWQEKQAFKAADELVQRETSVLLATIKYEKKSGHDIIVGHAGMLRTNFVSSSDSGLLVIPSEKTLMERRLLEAGVAEKDAKQYSTKMLKRELQLRGQLQALITRREVKHHDQIRQSYRDSCIAHRGAQLDTIFKLKTEDAGSAKNQE
ncbi:MAG: hypothetical protein ACR2RF_12700, partial [Geminicoccaceae bacterium]